jgi:hypothetical protein
MGVGSPQDYVYARTLVSFDSLASPQQGNTFIVTTFPRALRADLPDIAERIERGWRPRRRFAATIGDGDITVWARRAQ